MITFVPCLIDCFLASCDRIKGKKVVDPKFNGRLCTKRLLMEVFFSHTLIVFPLPEFFFTLLRCPSHSLPARVIVDLLSEIIPPTPVITCSHSPVASFSSRLAMDINSVTSSPDSLFRNV